MAQYREDPLEALWGRQDVAPPQQEPVRATPGYGPMNMSRSCAGSPEPPVRQPVQYSMGPWLGGHPLRPPAPPSNPGAATMDMSPAAFEAWATSVEDYGLICGWSPPLAASYVRLLCNREIQQHIDARMEKTVFRNLSTEEAITVIRSVVIGTRCEVRAWADFFLYTQCTSDSVRNYISKCRALAGECNFQCPNCAHSLDDYVLCRKVIMGLCDRNTKVELLRCFPRLNSLSDVIRQCELVESVEKSAGQRAPGQVAGVAPAQPLPALPPDPDPPEVAATNSRNRASNPQQPTHRGGRGRGTRRCKKCGNNECRGDQSCRARGATCRSCGTVGHFWRWCPTLTPKGGSATSGAVIVGGIGGGADLPVRVSCAQPKADCTTQAVADTGAQVSVSGRSLLKAMGISPRHLQSAPAPITHVGGGGLKVLGSLVCHISAGAHTTSEQVFVAEGAKCLYLSLKACKALHLVPQDFPCPEARISAAMAPDDTPRAPTRPDTPPCALVEENVPRLEEWFLEHFGRSVFAVGRTPLPEMSGPPHHIHLRPGACPHAVHVPAAVPRHFYDEVRHQLDEDVKKGIIEEVPAGEPTEWCARMVVVPKKDGKPRRTVDFQKLNQASLRETHHSRPPFDLITSVPKHTYKTVVDAYSGYHQIPLDECSRKLTTFITPWGRFRYLRTPMGHCAAQDAFTKRLDDILACVPRKLKCVDDTLIHDDSVTEAFWHTYDLLQKCADNGVTLRPDKFRFCRRSVTFAGYLLGWEEYQPSRDLISSITDFKMSTHPTLTDVRSWFGLVNQVAPFVAVAPIMDPFRDLLKKPSSKTVYWDDNLESIFKSTKATIVRLAEEGLRYYDTSRPTAVLTDYSRQGIGFLVMQQYCQCISREIPSCCPGGWKLVLCGSRHLTTAEKNYSTLEGEALAIAWCLKKARLFLLGCKNLTFVTDHRALVKIFGDKELKDIHNPRVLHLKEKTLMFSFRIIYTKGGANCAADALSRYPTLTHEPDESDECMDEVICAAMASAAADTTCDNTGHVVDIPKVEDEAGKDEEYRLLHDCVTNNGWAERKDQEPLPLRPFFRMRRHLSCQGGLVLYTCDERHPRLVIPTSLRRVVLANLHAGHQGRDSMLRRARQSVYWPGIDADVEQKRRQCIICETHAPSQPAETLMPTSPPQYPFQQAVADLFQLEGNVYIAYADRLTGWLEVEHLATDATSPRLITAFRRWFRRFGIPEELSCDGGTNLTSQEAKDFFSGWRVKLRISSAHYAQSNGRAEAAVKSAKRLLRGNITRGGSLDTDAVARALMQYLNTPLQDSDTSPAQLLAGRQLRDAIPSDRSLYSVSEEWGRLLREREREMVRSSGHTSHRYDQTAHNLTPLTPGQHTRIQNPVTRLWDRSGVIIESPAPRQYAVRLDGSGRVTNRNRRHLRPLTGAPGPEAQQGHPEAAPAHPPSPPASLSPRPRRTRRAPRHLDDYIPLDSSVDSV